MTTMVLFCSAAHGRPHCNPVDGYVTKYGVRSILLALPLPEGSWVESLSLILPVFHDHFLLTTGFFSLKTKKYLHRHPVDS
jgi:hypothetical protein